MRVALIAPAGALADQLTAALSDTKGIDSAIALAPGSDLEPGLAAADADLALLVPTRVGRDLLAPDLEQATAALDVVASSGVGRLVLLSSALVNPPSYRHLGMVAETALSRRPRPGTVPATWRQLEAATRERFAEERLTILRAVPTPERDGRNLFSRLLAARVAVTVAGHDPSIQLLARDDLVQAVGLAVTSDERGVFNIAPDGSVPLHTAIRLARRRALALPYHPQRIARRLLGLGAAGDTLNLLRYTCTVSNARARRELGFAPRHTSATLAAALGGGEPPAEEPDAYGMSKSYIDFLNRTIYHLAYRYWWRVELDGVEHIPRQGRAVLAGVHRGFMPFDGVVTLKAMSENAGRYPRFLIHPSLTKFPFLSDFMAKLGGILACQENADWVLDDEEMVGIYPEGINGAFTPYERAYQLGKFGRDEFVRIALRKQAPILPFVTVGNAEIFPIFAKLQWSWWIRLTEWPCFPIAPPFPLLPIPLPSKWHIQFLEPLDVAAEHPPEAADDPEVVGALSDEVRRRMQAALDDLCARRKHRFWGSIFGQDAAAPGARE